MTNNCNRPIGADTRDVQNNISLIGTYYEECMHIVLENNFLNIKCYNMHMSVICNQAKVQ